MTQMHKVYTPSNDEILLETQIAAGGEGAIWQTHTPDLIAKLYHTPSDAHLRKLKAMVQSPPQDPTLKMDHVSIAWPQEIIFSSRGEFLGFLMPRVSGSLTLNNIYNPKLRKKKAAGFNWYYLYTAAMNIASILESLHGRGYVVGDIKTDNLLVNEKALVSITDTDSFQVKTSRELFKCPVGSEGFTPPELVGKDFASINRTEEHDRFGLAVLIHLLLMGSHPYAGAWKEGQEPLPRDEAVAGGFWPYGPTSVVTLSPLAIPMDVLYPPIKEAFLTTFNEGHNTPKKRLKASQWRALLNEGLDHLVACHHNSNHFYDKYHSSCVWCRRAEKLGTDIFPHIEGESPLHITEAFSQAVARKDRREMVRLWDAHKFIQSEPKYQSYREQIDNLRKALAELDAFKSKCQSGASDEEIIEMWATYPDLHIIASSPQEMVQGQPIQQFLNGLKQRREIFLILQERLEEIEEKIRRKEGELTQEKEVIELMSKYLSLSNSKGQVLSSELQARSELAKRRTLAWSVLCEAEKKDDATFLEAWREAHSLFKGFVIPEEMRQRAEQAQGQEASLVTFEKLLKSHPYDDAALLALWEENALLHDSTFASLPFYKGKSLQEFVQEAQKREKIYQELKWAAENGSLKEMAEKWDEQLCGAHPRFATLKKKVGFAHDLYKKWTRVRKAVLEDVSEQVFNLWDESFTPFALELGIEKEIQETFLREMAASSQFPTEYVPQVAAHRDYWYLTFPWPQLVWESHKTSPAPYVIITAQNNRFPKDAEDVNNGLHRVVLAYQKGQTVGQTLFPRTHSANQFSLWAACYICGYLLPIGDPLLVSDINPFLSLTYTLTLKRIRKGKGRWRVDICFNASQEMMLPAMEIMGVLGRVPILGDKEALRFAHIPSREVPKGQSTLEVMLEREYDPTISLRLYPLDRAFLDTVTLLEKRAA